MLTFFMVSAQEKVNKETQAPIVRWTISNNYSKSNNGQLFIQLPVQGALSCTVNKTGEAKSFALRNETPKELPPANYEVTFWGIKIPAVAVEKRKDTRILAGILNSIVKAPWEVWTSDGIKVYGAGGPKQVAGRGPLEGPGLAGSDTRKTKREPRRSSRGRTRARL